MPNGSYCKFYILRQTRRGYTGHEHLDEFGLINMNARLYDPLLGRFLAPDPYVQSPVFSQNFNRYAYCLNNPLIYTDPDGEFILGFVSGFIRGLVQGKNPFKTGWQTGVNELKIIGGLFAADTKQRGWGWQIFSRFTWELPQTVLGFAFSYISNTAWQVDNVEYKYGATVLSGNFWGAGDRSAVTLGSFINGGRDLKADPHNSLFQHEYGHYLQSQAMGWAYFSRVGIPSLFSADGTGNHKYQPFEQDANRRAFMYFNENVEDFYTSETEYWEQYRNNSYFNGTSKGWNFFSNPLDVNHTAMSGVYYDYRNRAHQDLIFRNLSLVSKWYDYLDPFGIFFAGWINNSYYKKHRIK